MKKLPTRQNYAPIHIGGILMLFILNSLPAWPQFFSQETIQRTAVSNNFFSESSSVAIDSALVQRSISLGELLQGQISNVKVTSSDGAPGAAIDIKVRGGSSVRGDFQPLYILDGVMINSSQPDAANAWASEDRADYQAVQNMLWSINTQDIKSVQVLKDASATAIYGSKGANGVIIIETKTGSRKEKEIIWSSNVGISTLARKQNLLSGSEYKNYYRELTGTDFSIGGAEIDWQKAVFTPAISHNHNLNVAGSVRRTNYYVSLMANQQTGLVPGTGTLDIGMKINLDQVISSMVRVGIRMLVARNATDMTQSTSLLGGSSLTNSISAVPFENTGENPYSWRDDYSDQSYTWRVIPQGYFDFNFNTWLKANVTGGVDYINKERFRRLGVQIDKGALENGRAGHSWMQTILYNIAANLTFNKYLDDHGLQITAGGELFGDDGVKLSNYASDFAIQTLNAEAINFASRAANPIYQKNNSTTYALYGSAYYKYTNLLEIQFGVRGDYLVDFDKSLQAYPFANTKVNLLQGRDGYVNSLSLKGGWGITGKSELIPYSIMNDITLGDASLFIPYEEALSFTGRLISRMNQLNAGFVTELFDNRITLSSQFYIGKVNDRFDVHDFRDALIVETSDETGATVSETIPYDKIYWRRDMAMNKWGIEASVSALAVKTKNFTWTIDANIGFDRSKITDCGINNTNPALGSTKEQGFVGRTVSGLSDLGVTAYLNGKAPGVFYGYQTQGVIKEEHVLLAPPFDGVRLQVGDPKYIDVNEDGTVDAGDKVVIGNPNPDFIFGLNSGFKYKNWSAQIRIDGSIGNDVLNLNKVLLDNVASGNNISSKAYHDAYRVSSIGAASGTLPMVGAQLLDQVSDRMVEDGSFVRLSNLSVGYDIPLKEKQERTIHSITVNLLANNLFVLSKYSGYDPDVNSFGGDWSRKGIDLGAYPRARTFSLGLVVKF